jgi:hypothetical protein
MFAAGSPPLQPTRAAQLLLDGVKIEPCTIIIMVTANDFGSTKTNPSQSPKHHIFFCERLVTLGISGVAVSFSTG